MSTIGKLKLFLYSVLIVGILSACSQSSKPNPTTVPPPSQFKLSELSYSNVYGQVIRVSCVGCHGTSAGINLETYASTKTHLQRIYQSVFVTHRMPKPPSTPLTDNQLGLLNAWIQAGAPESPSGDKSPPIPPLEPTFASIKYHIIESKCLFCHAPGKPVARIPLVTKEEILDSPLELALPGNPDESGLILAITHDDPRKIMPPPRDDQGNSTGFSKLSDAEIQTIYDWINNGAKD